MVLYLQHQNEDSVLSYYTEISRYFDKDKIKAYDFITLSRSGNELGLSGKGSRKIKPYMVPVQQYNSHPIYFFLDAKPLDIHRKMINNVNRFYCSKLSCKRLARILKNEDLRPLSATLCKKHYFNL